MTDSAPPLRQVFFGEDRVSGTIAKVRRELAGLKNDAGPVGAALGRMLVPLAAGVSVAGITAWVNRVVEGVDALNDWKDATGASIENLSGLEDVALRTGTSLDTAGAAVIKLNQALNAAKNPKSDAAQAIKAIGLSVEELQQLDPVEALQRIGVALAGFADDGNKGRIILELLGKSAKEMAPLLNDLAQAGKLQAKVTTQQAEEAEKLRKEWFALEKNALDLSRAVAGPLVTALNSTLDAFRGTNQYAGELTGTAATLAVPLQALSVLGAEVAFVFKGIGTEIGGLAAQAKMLATGNLAGVKAIRNEMVADAEAARKAQDELLARIMNVNGAANDALRRSEDRGFTPTPKTRLPSLGDKPDLAAARKAAEERRKLAEFAAQQLVTIEEQAAQDAAEAWKFWERQQLDDQKARADALKLQWQQVFEFIDQEEERAIEEGRLFLETQRAGKEAAEELALVFSSAAGEAITQWQGVQGLLKGILQDVAQLALRETVTKPLGTMVAGALEGFSFKDLGAQALKWLFNADGNVFDAAGIRRFASGDVFGSPTLFRYGGGRTGVMGEAGPEAVMPLKRGPDGKLGVAGGGNSVSIAINVGAGASTDDWRRSKRQIAADLQRTLRRGGAIA